MCIIAFLSFVENHKLSSFLRVSRTTLILPYIGKVLSPFLIPPTVDQPELLGVRRLVSL